jgi:hypothetical protein
MSEEEKCGHGNRGILSSVRFALHKCGIVDEFSHAISCYAESAALTNRNILANLKDKWAVAEETMEVFRGQDNKYMDPEMSPVISTSKSLNMALLFSTKAVFSLHIMPGIRYIDVESTKSYFTSMYNESEIILEGGQDLYISGPYTYDGLIPMSLQKSNPKMYGVAKTLRDSETTIYRCVYAPKGSDIPFTEIGMNPAICATGEVAEDLSTIPELRVSPFITGEQVDLKKYKKKAAKSKENRRGRAGSAAGAHGGGNDYICDPKSFEFIYQLKQLQAQNGGRRRSRRRTRRRRQN